MSTVDSPLRASDTRLENEHLLVEVDPSTGWLNRLHLKDFDVDLAAPGPHAVVVDDPSDTWGHRVRRYDKAIGEFTPVSVRLVEHGAVRAVIRIVSRYGESTLTEELVLGACGGHLEVRVSLDWHERLKLLKLRFPTGVAADEATFEVPYGHLTRPADGAEEAAQGWVDVTGAAPDGRVAGLAVLNDGKYGHDVLGGSIGMTVARSPVYAWHEPKVLDPSERYDYLDQGAQEFRYALVPHAGDWRGASLARRAAELNQPVFPLLESYHAGPLPQAGSYLSVDDPAVVPTVLKLAEDGSGDLVLRAYESTGRAVRATVALPFLGREVVAEFGPSEVKTLRVPRDADRAPQETDLIEWAERPPGQPPQTGIPGPDWAHPTPAGPDHRQPERVLDTEEVG